ncbi:thiamine phosphate synthase [Sporosarcina sp. YIM B06819]|uniref:thiamine phosphate synthase n=1 Tax=Sporosarcina sp. YIM B06819 TaxID=3081769 RepID=UPI00298CFB51|nr:thiamine phosphate synthase [Sporosarcina sp. YIM B06819]
MIKQQLQLYFIMGSVNTGASKPLEVLEAALQGGVTCFQLREKGPGALIGDEKQAFAVACQTLCRHFNVPFIVNDDVELAIAIDADGVHVGQDDEMAAIVRDRIGKDKILGVSVHNESEMLAAIEVGADYVGMGPIYATSSKADAKPVSGTAFIREMSRLYPAMPIVGIGGITIANFKPVLEAGASGVSIISAIASTIDPYIAARRFKIALNKEVISS